MLRSAMVAALGGAWLAVLTGCGSGPAATPTVHDTSVPSLSAAPSPSATASATPTSSTVTVADLQAVYARLYPSTGDCLTSTGTVPSDASCPFTARLSAQVTAIINNPNAGGSADPVCGCQAFDPHQTAAYTLGTPAGGGIIRVTAFGTPQVEYVVVASGGQFLVDDIDYCGVPRSAYATLAAKVC